MKFTKHPAYIGFAEESDKRSKKYKKQFEKQGFDDTVTWALDTSIARFIYPRLKCFYKLSDKVIDIDSREGFREAIEEMIEGFKLLSKDGFYDPEQESKIEKAWELLSKWHRHLWW